MTAKLFLLVYEPVGAAFNDWCGCRRFTRSLTARKTIKSWGRFCGKWGVNAASLADIYRLTSKGGGLVHAVKGPRVVDDKYTVTLAPVGLQKTDAVPKDEQQAQHAAHCLLHGLAALHSVSDHILSCCFVSRALRARSSPDTHMLGCCILVKDCCTSCFK